MEGKLATKRLPAQVPALEIYCHPERRALHVRSENVAYRLCSRVQR
jgi:hypothetical protein